MRRKRAVKKTEMKKNKTLVRAQESSRQERESSDHRMGIVQNIFTFLQIKLISIDNNKNDVPGELKLEGFSEKI